MRRPAPPLLVRRANDEYVAPPDRPCDVAARREVFEGVEHAARRLGGDVASLLIDPRGTAATLRAIDAAAGGGYYEVDPDCRFDREAAAEAFRGGGPVIDVQTHFVASGRSRLPGAEGVLQFIESVAPDRFSDLDPEVDLSFAEFLRCVYLESETALAVLTAAPGDDDRNILSNAEIAGARELVDRLSGTGRLLHHAIVHPDAPGEIDGLGELVDRRKPDGLKLYTLYGSPGGASRRGWMLDDQEVGLPFLERASALGVRRICAHKGLSGLAETGSPRDIGPAAAAHPELDFLVYHSGYEVPRGDHEERAFSAANPDHGTNRLVATLRKAAIEPGSNVYAELGSTWYVLLRRPLEAAHVLGKLLLAVGEDNVLWGTDSVWYGPSQPLIDAFRAFQIPEALRERHGYPELTSAIKDKILGGNAARVYDVDLTALTRVVEGDDLAWTREAMREAAARGFG